MPAMRNASVFLVLLLSGAPWVAASQYSPPGVYDIEHLTLHNGLRVLLKPRTTARSASIRLVVGVGTHDFPCGRRETPHLLEHLLFTGTSRHTEAELDSLIEKHGGTWNARTGYDKTVYLREMVRLLRTKQVKPGELNKAMKESEA